MWEVLSMRSTLRAATTGALAVALLGLAGPAEAGKESIPCLTVPSLLTIRPMEHINLLKCDIEGSEAELFANCASWIGRVENLIIEVHPPYSTERLHEDLRRASWEFDICDQQQRGTEFSLCVLRRRK